MALLVAAPLPAAQLGGEVTGDSAQRAGMAGAGMAAAESPLDAAVNPAALAAMFRGGESGRLDLTGRLVWNPTTVRTTTGAHYTIHGVYGGGPFLAYAQPLATNAWWGIALVPTAGGAASYTRRTFLNVATANSNGPPWIPREHDVQMESSLVQVGLDPSLAWQVDRRLSIGIGASLRTTRVGLKSATDVSLDDLTGEVPGLGGLTWSDLFKQLAATGGRQIDSIQADIDSDSSANLNAFLQIGALWDAAPGRRLSFWYRSPSTPQDLEGRVRVDVNPDVGEILNVFGLSGVSDFRLRIPSVHYPQEVGLALYQELDPQTRLMSDLVWTDWSSTFNGWTATVSDPQGGDLGAMLHNGTTTVDLGMRWSDSVRLSLGWEHDLFRRRILTTSDGLRRTQINGRLATLRAGLGWTTNPVEGAPLLGAAPYNNWTLACGATLWGRRGAGDWNLALVAALPQHLRSGDNPLLSDLDGDLVRQANLALVVGWSLAW